MAAPHVAGAAALYLQGHRRAKPEQVKAVILDQATTGKVGQRRAGSPNRLLYSRLKGPPPNNVLRNSSFESGTASGWTASPGVITRDPGEGAYTGAWKAWLGGTGTAHTDELEQQVNIPSQVRALLSLYLRTRTNDPRDRREDVLTVEVDASGQTWTVGRVDNNVSGLGMVRRTYNLTPYAGGSVTIRFKGTEDDIGLTNFVIDQVALSTNG
jgi:subtilisin family serine protease